jgi:hypothetical protein
MAELSVSRREARRLIKNQTCHQTKIAMIEVLMCFAESSHEREELLQLTESLVEKISLESLRIDETIALSVARSEETSAEEGIFHGLAGGGTQTIPKIDPSLWDTDPDLAHALLLSGENGYVKQTEVSHNHSKESTRRSLAEEAAFHRSLERMTSKERIKALQDRERSQKKG